MSQNQRETATGGPTGGTVGSAQRDPRRWWVALVVLAVLALLAVTGLVLGVFLLVATPDVLAADPVVEYNVYLALQVLAGAGSAAAVLALWWSWHRLEVVRDADDGPAPTTT